ncbi:response regulator [Moorella sp. Hama-1]|uniref:response regulator n=1 Tax=Moorella sp. Hama-1 TaxID=2138101 RepID=UPI000D65BB5F|nr:response regulator [Moorella sp. Hama-1]MDN5362539.1 Response regulator receiver domain [Moorella sp. (in: firmicutes)]BCV22662.1 hypothetical protein hamaS1_27310 [Moorella sp. Hama-1]
MMQAARVLLVEDDVNSARLLKDLLTAKGAAVVTHENNGVDAIERAKRESFDLIILDLRLPGKTVSSWLRI